MNILFVCSWNKWRSATAETIFKGSQIHHLKSAGTEPSAVVKVTAKHILWADLIFAIEKRHKERLVEKFSDVTRDKKIIVLDIEDHYKYMDPELIDMINESIAPYLGCL